MSDVEGRFVLPHLMWYPGASYNLIISADAYHLKRMELHAPPICPKDGIVDVGELRFENGYELDREATLVRPIEYDRDNIAFYTRLFNRLTDKLETDEQALDAINKYVAKGSTMMSRPAISGRHDRSWSEAPVTVAIWR